MSSKKRLDQSDAPFESEQSEVQPLFKDDVEVINLEENTESDEENSFIEIEIEESSSCETISDEEEETLNLATKFKNDEILTGSEYFIDNDEFGFQRVPESNDIPPVQLKIENDSEFDANNSNIVSKAENNTTLELNQVSVGEIKMEECDNGNTSTKFKEENSDVEHVEDVNDYVNISSESENEHSFSEVIIVDSNNAGICSEEEDSESYPLDKRVTETDLCRIKETREKNISIPGQEKLMGTTAFIKENSCYRNENNRNKEIVLTLIEEYRRIPQLWHNKLSFRFDSFQKATFLEKITDNLNEKLNTDFSLHRIKMLLCFICKQYEAEVEKQLIGYEETKAENSCLWFYKELRFLKYQTVKKFNNKLENTQNMKNIDATKLPIFIEMYKNNEVLWQVNDKEFGIAPKRNEIFNKILEELETKHNLKLNLNELQNYIEYLNQMYYKEKEQELKCESDKTKFKPTSDLYGELEFLKESQGPFKCPQCQAILKKYEDYCIHIAQHNNTIPFPGKYCEMKFQKLKHYKSYVERHLTIYSHNCDVCGKGYPTKPELDGHMTSHTEDKPFLCSTCGASFRTHHYYDNHIRRHEKRFRYECHICKKGFNLLGHLRNHVKTHLNIRDVICNVCGKGFTAATYLYRHKLIHQKEKRYKCTVCGKAFAQDAGLRAHRKVHQPGNLHKELK